ncbi:MAG TPA: hypothetical protein VGH44_00005, partial [Candidatus Saccharimonadia bacterium]
MNEIVRIIKYSWDLKRYYLWTAFFVVLTSIFSLATPFFLKYLVDGIVRNGKGEHVPLNYFILILVLILVVNVLTTVISNIQG